MAIEFAPRSVPLQRRLQTAAVLQWVYSFLGLAQTCIILFFVLVFTRFWIISVLYGIYWFYDWDTPSHGGRRSNLIRRSVVWRYLRDYFPITEFLWRKLNDFPRYPTRASIPTEPQTHGWSR